MDRSTLIKEIMTTEVISVRPTDTMDKVDRIFNTADIHHIPVVSEDRKVTGIISKSDYFKILHGFTLFKAPVSKTYNEAVLRSLLAKEVMTQQVATLHPEDTVSRAADYFRENRFHAIPIVDEQRRLAGILSTYDLINSMFKAVSME